MNTKFTTLLVLAGGVGLGHEANAISLSLDPAAGSVTLGGTALIDIDITGLVGPLALGGYTLEVSYDGALLGANSLTFGSGLNLGTPAASSPFSDLSGAGVVHFEEVSLVDSATLQATQPTDFTLATIEFKGLAKGVSKLSFTLVDLADNAGGQMFAGSIGEGTLTVVPESQSFAWVAGLGLVAYTWTRRARRA